MSTLLAARGDADEWHVVWDSRKALDKWLAILRIAEDEVGAGTALAAPEIATVAEVRFRINGVHANNVSRDLKRARDLVIRRPRGKGFEFALTRKGIAYIDGRRTEDSVADG